MAAFLVRLCFIRHFLFCRENVLKVKPVLTRPRIPNFIQTNRKLITSTTSIMPPKRKTTRAKKAVEDVEIPQEETQVPEKKPVRKQATKKKEPEVEEVAIEEAVKPEPKGRQTKKLPLSKKKEPEAVAIDEPVVEAAVEKTDAKPKNKRTTKKTKAEPEPEKAKPEEPQNKRTRRGTAPETATSAAPLKNKATTDFDEVSFACDKKTKGGEAFNLKISSWNVDGLRAWVKKGGLQYLSEEDPDIFCLQETKCSEEQLPEEVKSVEGYHVYWCTSGKSGYAGVAIFTKEKPLSVVNGIGDEGHDSEGRIITAEFDAFFLVNTYVPNAGRKLVTLPKRLEWNELFLKHVKSLETQKPVIICGDMNVAHNEIDLANPKTNKRNAGFTQEERDGMTQLLSQGFTDTFRKLYPELADSYTFWTYMSNARANNVGWRLDYFLVSEALADNVCENAIRSGVYGSDHCPIVLFVKV